MISVVVSSETTLNIYTHITDNMQRSAANKVEQSFGRNEGSLSEDKLAELIMQMNAEIPAEKKRLKIEQSA